MPPKAQGWKPLPQRAAEGDYELVDPLDFLVLEVTPDEGELVMGYYPLAVTTPELTKDRFPTFSPGQMAGVMKRLILQGLAVRVRTSGARTHGYQRTKQGKKLYDEWRKKNPNLKAPDMSGAKGKT